MAAIPRRLGRPRLERRAEVLHAQAAAALDAYLDAARVLLALQQPAAPGPRITSHEALTRWQATRAAWRAHQRAIARLTWLSQRLDRHEAMRAAQDLRRRPAHADVDEPAAK